MLEVFVIKITAMSFNIRHGRGLDGKVNLNRVADLIKKTDADIVALNEVDKCFAKRSNYEDQGKWLGNQLKMNYCFGPAISIKKREYGNAILSRFPITASENFVFHIIPIVAEPRAILKTSIAIGSSTITVLASHFSFHPLINKRQINFCLERDLSTPIMIMGDFNRKPSSASYSKMLQHYQDCFHNNSRYTFPARQPKSRIDYIFVNHFFSVERAYTIDTDISDHLPVIAELTMV